MLYEIYNMLTDNIFKYVNDMQDTCAKENVSTTTNFKGYLKESDNGIQSIQESVLQ